MPYRQASAPRENDTWLVCRRCAERTAIALAEKTSDTFVCTRCQFEQPVLLDLVAIESLRHVSNVGSSYTELVPFIASLGVSGTPHNIKVSCDGIEATVELSVNSGTVMGVDLMIANDGLPEMRLSNETRRHVAAKEQGFAREVQTGDEAFDQQVYIESEATDDVVRTVLAAPAVRSAIRALLGGCDEVRIKENKISVFVSRNQPDAYDEDSLRKRLAALRAIAGAPRPFVHAYTEVPRAARTVKSVAFFGMPFGIFVLVLGGIVYPPFMLRQVLLAAALGLGVMLAIQPLLRRALGGRSSSLRDLRTVRILTVIWLPMLVSGGAMVINGACDRSKTTIETMDVVAVHQNDDGESVTTARDAHGEEHDFTFRQSVVTGSKLTVGVRQGALGWPWRSSAALVVPLR